MVRWAVLSVVALGLSPLGVEAQSDGRFTLGGSVGIGRRGAGDIADCCGPFTSELVRSKSLWLGGSVCRWVTPHLGLEADVTWVRDDSYDAYVQGEFGGAPYRGYRATDDLRTITAAGLLRVRAAGSSHYALDVVGGIGWAMERGQSHLQSIVFKPGPAPLPDLTFDSTETRHRLAALLGVEIGGPSFGSSVEVFASLRVQRLVGSPDPVRTDLELGRTVWRIAAGVRRSF